MDALRHDLRLALLALRRHPGFTFVAALSVALGVGFNATIFSAINTLLLQPVPGVEAGGRAVEIGRTTGGEGFDTFGYRDFLALRDGVGPLEAVAAWRSRPLSLGTAEGAERIPGMTVSPDYFAALGGDAHRGRLFGPEEDARGGPAVAVVSHRFWQDRLGGRPDVVGSPLELNRTPFTVIGVTEPGFTGHIPMIDVAVWTPIARTELADPEFDTALYDRWDGVWLHLVGRLADGASLERAEAAAAAVMGRLAREHPDTHGDRGARVIELGPVPGAGRGFVTGFLGVLMGLVGLILLITAANVAGMLLARAAQREKEIGIRLALGSGRGRLIRQLTLESATLFVLGGVAGAGLAWAGARLLSTLTLPGPDPMRIDISADATVLLFALGLALTTGLLFGLVPALRASRVDLLGALRSDGRGGVRTGRMRRTLVAGQVGVSLLLLVAAGLFLRSLQRAGEVDAGFDPSDVRVASLTLALDGYDDASGPLLQDRLLERLRATPGIDAAALALDLPLDLASHGTPSWPEGWDDPDGRGLGTEFNVVSPGYFDALRIPVLEGRGFESTDGPEAPPVVVVNRALAERVWPGADPVGRRLRFGAPDAPLRTVVGVVEDVKNQTLSEVVDPMVYLPGAQRYAPDAYLVVGGRTVTSSLVRRSVREVDPRLAVGAIQRLDRVTGLGMLPQRLAAGLASALGALALFLAMLGVYGVIAHSVSRRRREIGVRMAVGASRRAVVGLVLRGGLALVLPGLLLGGVAALFFGRLLRSLLFGIAPTDPLTLILALLVLLGAVVAASGLPAARAARLDPMAALRSD